MAKVAIKSESITPFGGNFLIFDILSVNIQIRII